MAASRCSGEQARCASVTISLRENGLVTSLRERAALLRERPGLLGRWCFVLEQARDDVRRAERESSALARRLLARLVRLCFEFLVLAVIAVAELDLLWRRAGNALAVRPKR